MGDEAVVSATLMADVCLAFVTAYDDPHRPGHWVTAPRRIALHYLRRWFWVDAPASLPLLEMYSLAVPEAPTLMGPRLVGPHRMGTHPVGPTR